MSEAVLAAVIGGGATIGAGILGLIGSIRKSQAIASLATVDDARALTAAELEAIKPEESVLEQLGAAPSPESSSNTLSVKLVYPGSSKFHEGDRDVSYSTYYSTSYSPISVYLDGEEVGSGNGENGFRLNFDLEAGRHTLVFSWTGEKTRYSNSGSRDTDLSGRVELILWVVRGGQCTAYLDQNFSLDHAEPRTILPTCYACKMPGSRNCGCGNRYCGEHAAVSDSKQVCLACRENKIQKQLKAARYALFIVGGLALLTAAYYWLAGGA